MNLDPPKLYRKIVCISDDYIMSAQLSSCFHRKKFYFSVLEPPRSLHKWWRNEFIKLNNVLAKIDAEKIILLNLKREIVDLIKDQLKIPENKYIYINTKEELEIFINKYSSIFKGTIECPPDRESITQALLEAKRKEFKLVVKTGVDYKYEKEEGRKHLLACDSTENLLPVVLANYAFAIDADIQFFKGNDRYTPMEIYSVLSDTRASGERSKTAKEIKREIQEKLNIELKNVNDYEFITFFTDDFQYGYFFPNIPSTHILNKLLVGQFIADAVAEPVVKTTSALLVDTGFFPNSETDYIRNALAKQNVVIRELRDDQFSNVDLSNYVQIYPYDFLFICSHGTFPEGTRFKIKFNDNNGVSHTILVDVLDSFGLTGKGDPNNPIVDVQTITEFVELDDQPWYQKKYKTGSSKTIVEDFMAIKREHWNVVEKKDVIMSFANAIVTKDSLGPYIPMIHGISDPFSSPFVFNNACVSTYTMGVNFIFAGASFYIGTVRNAKDSVAIQTAIGFFEKTIIQNKSLALSLWEVQVEAKIPYDDRVYICIGCHFQRFLFNKTEDTQKILKSRIARSAFMRLKSSEKTNLEDNVKQRHLNAVEFLKKVTLDILQQSK